ncbi:MAG: ABC transporter substrate-binding protein, partial [Aristaeellaceae bacterium]
MKSMTRMLALLMSAMLLLSGVAVAHAEETTYDFGGMTISFCNWWGWDLTPGLSDQNDRLIARIAETEEKFNVKIEMRKGPEEYYDNMVATIMAGEPYGDMMFAFPWNFPGWMKAGAAYDLTDIIAETGIDLSQYSPVATNVGEYDGRYYGVNKEMPDVNSMVAFNKRLLEEAGLESPYDLIAKGEWTFAKLQEYAKALTKTDADGVTTQYGFSAYDPYGTLATTFVTANNAGIVEYVDGKATFALDSANALEALNVMYDMANVDKSLFLYDAGADWATSTNMFIAGDIAMMNAPTWVIECYNAWNMEDDFGLVPFPMGPQATEFVDDTNGQAVYFVPSCVDKDRATAALVVYDAVFSDLYPELTEDERYESKFMR